jgi:hypothetical protein
MFSPSPVQALNVHIETDKTIAELKADLRNKDPRVRADTVRKLSRYSNPDIVSLLISVTQKEDDQVRWAAIRVLGKRSEDNPTQVIDTLIGLLDDPDQVIRVEAASQLGNFSDSRVVDALCKVLEKQEASNVLVATCYSLEKIGTPEAIDRIIPLLKHEDSWVVSRTRGSLETLGWEPEGIGATIRYSPMKIVEILFPFIMILYGLRAFLAILSIRWIILKFRKQRSSTEARTPKHWRLVLRLIFSLDSLFIACLIITLGIFVYMRSKGSDVYGFFFLLIPTLILFLFSDILRFIGKLLSPVFAKLKNHHVLVGLGRWTRRLVWFVIYVVIALNVGAVDYIFLTAMIRYRTARSTISHTEELDIRLSQILDASSEYAKTIPCVNLTDADKRQVISSLLNLTRIESPSWEESKLREYLLEELTSLGGVEIDCHAGDEDAPLNLVVEFPGTAERATLPALILNAHMDTITWASGCTPEGINFDPNSGKFFHAEAASFGGDDKAGVVTILEAIRIAHQKYWSQGTSHRPIRLILTAAEEAKNRGISYLTHHCPEVFEGAELSVIVDGDLPEDTYPETLFLFGIPPHGPDETHPKFERIAKIGNTIGNERQKSFTCRKLMKWPSTDACLFPPAAYPVHSGCPLRGHHSNETIHVGELMDYVDFFVELLIRYDGIP